MYLSYIKAEYRMIMDHSLCWLLCKITKITLAAQNDALLHRNAFTWPYFISGSKHIVSSLAQKSFHRSQGVWFAWCQQPVVSQLIMRGRWRDSLAIRKLDFVLISFILTFLTLRLRMPVTLTTCPSTSQSECFLKLTTWGMEFMTCQQFMVHVLMCICTSVITLAWKVRGCVFLKFYSSQKHL